jgi:glyoxylase-like metal-dependent hydrolase (beta-lactamase superfamily II)
MYRSILVLLMVSCAGLAEAQQDEWDAVEVRVVTISDGLHMLVGRGGNIGLSVGEDGTFLVDDQFAPLTDKIVAAVRTVTADPVRFIVNTHFHGDHSGGNENFGKRGSIIVAHQNVRKRMSVEQVRQILRQDRTPAAPPEALPKITFAEEVTFHWNGDTIRVFHVENAHTDGDSIIHFTNADVFHTGDVFFNGRYPFIDIDSGGNVNGIIAAADRLLSMSQSTTKFLPGHGEMATPEDLRRYRDMLSAVRDRVQALIDQGKSVDEAVAAKPTADFDTRLGAENAEGFVRSVYFSLTL